MIEIRFTMMPLLFAVTAVFSGISSTVHASGEIERNFAGSAQADYLRVVTEKRPPEGSFEGFTTELALKVAVDFTADLSANVKICYGCHGFEADMAFFDIRAFDELNFGSDASILRSETFRSVTTPPTISQVPNLCPTTWDVC